METNTSIDKEKLTNYYKDDLDYDKLVDFLYSNCIIWSKSKVNDDRFREKIFR